MVAKKITKGTEKTSKKTNESFLDDMKQIYHDLSPEKKLVCFGMLEEAAFLKTTLSKLREEINEEGYTDEYKNGENQYGRKVSATLQSYNATLKNYYVLMEKLMKMFPLEEEQTDELLELMSS